MTVRAKRFKFGTVVLIIQVVFILLYAFLGRYADIADPKKSLEQTDDPNADLTKKYPPFQDVHVMIFVGFGFLMTFLKRYGYTSFGINMFLSALVIQWAFIVRGIVVSIIYHGHSSFALDIGEMISGDFAAATILISFGAVLGKTSPLQLLVMAIVEVLFSQFNGFICHVYLHAVDPGESMFIHAFGAYFGLAVSRILYTEESTKSKKSEPVYHSDLFSYIGTIFLWMYWPSFNGGGLDADEKHRAFINTYLSLCACTITTFAISAYYDQKGKFTSEFIQNATLAGGVAVGTTGNMPLQPWGALLMGTLAAIISVSGYRFLSEFLAEKLKIHDTCGVHNLHGMPGVFAAIVGAILAAMSSVDSWGNSVYQIFPNMAPDNETLVEHINANLIAHGQETIKAGSGWSAGTQGGFQILALLITILLAVIGGVIAGFIIKLPVFDNIENEEDLFDDMCFWNVPEEGYPAVEGRSEGEQLTDISKNGGHKAEDNSDHEQQDDLILSLGQSHPLVPQCVSSRRQPLVEFDLSSSEDSNGHPFAPQVPKLLPPNHLKPISSRRKAKHFTNAQKQNQVEKDEQQKSGDTSSSEDSKQHPFAPEASKPLPPKYLKPISPRRNTKSLTTPRSKDSPGKEGKDKDSLVTSVSAVPLKPQDSVSTVDSGKSSLSDESADSLGKDDNIPPRQKKGKAKLPTEIKRQAQPDEVALLRDHLMRVYRSGEDTSSSILSYLASDIDFVSPDIVSLTSRKTDEDPFNTTYNETKLESLEQIFTDDGAPFKRIFIQGDAGSGKSTLLKKITKDWVNTKRKTEDLKQELTSYELFLNTVALAFLVRLDEVVDEKDIETVLNKYVIGKDCPVNNQNIANLIQQQGPNCLFLLDGYDECSDASGAIDKLLAGETFPNATLVLTSQQWKSPTPIVSETFDAIFEIKRFNDEQSRLFISNFMKSKQVGVTDKEIIESEVWDCIYSTEYKWIRASPLLLLFGCIRFLEMASISASRSELYKDLIQCLHDVYKREKTCAGGKQKKKSSKADMKPDITLQALLINTGKIAFRCLMGRKQCPKRVPSLWFDQEMYRDYLLLALELGILQETKIFNKQKELPVATFAVKSIAEYLAAYYLCNVNDASTIFHEQAAIIELIKSGKIEKAFVYKFLDILIFAAGINPLITCELLTILIPEMESDSVVMRKLSKCAEEMESMEGMRLPLIRLYFDQIVSQRLVELCKETLEYLTLSNCEIGTIKVRTGDLNDEEMVSESFLKCIENLPNLKFLKLDHVNIHRMSPFPLNFARLQELVLRAVCPVGNGVMSILNRIQSPVLQEVTIDYCEFGDEEITFRNLEDIDVLTLGNIKLSPLGWKSLLQSLQTMTKLSTLVCSNMTILGKGVVFPSLKFLTKLELCKVEYDPEASSEDFYASFNKLRHLEVLEVSAMAVNKLVRHLGDLPKLRRVSLSSIRIDSDIYWSKSNLRDLELNYLTFDDHSGQSFISSMACLPNLATLAICYCNFGKENTNVLKLKTLKKLKLVNNLMTSNCWCVNVFSIGQLGNIDTLEVTYSTEEEQFVGELIKDMVDQRSPVPKIASCTRSGKDKTMIVDFTNKEPLMKTGSCCIQ